MSISFSFNEVNAKDFFLARYSATSSTGIVEENTSSQSILTFENVYPS
jgi:hypothetical protein